MAQNGANVVLEVQPELRSLMASLDRSVRVIGRDDATPEFHFHAPLMSLPSALGTTLDNIPAAVPYLFAPEEKTRLWRDRLPRANLRVGLVWAGNPLFKTDALRSIGLAGMAPLLSVPGVQFVSLHREVRAEHADMLGSIPQILHFGAQLEDLGDTAAVISELDLVIGSDTAVIHLAGALAKPVWLLASFAPDWRWMQRREDSPWYPTMRLYRQPKIGDWQSVVARVRDDLSLLTAGG
jgi:hypothetical protein